MLNECAKESSLHYPASPASNLAGEAKVTVSSEVAGFEGRKAVDRIWGQSGSNGGEWASNETNPSIKLDWEDTKAICKVVIYDRIVPDANANGGMLAFSDDSIIDARNIPTDGLPLEIAFAEKQDISWVKFLITGGQGENVGLAEIKVFGTPVKPKEYDVTDEEIAALMERLDLKYPGLEAVKTDSDKQNYQKAAKDLLSYYKERTSICFIPERAKKRSCLGLPLEPKGEKQLRKIFSEWSLAEDHPKKYVYLGEHIDWFKNPTGIHGGGDSMSFLFQFNGLTHNYWCSGDEDYVKEFIEEFLDWYNHHPVPRDTGGNYVYTGSAGSSVYVYTDTLFCAIRLGVLTGCFQQIIDSLLFTKGVLVKFLNLIFEHVDYLRHYDGSYMPLGLDHFSDGNFGIYEANGIAAAGILFPEFKNAMEWRSSAANLFKNKVTPFPEGEFYSDGMYYEEVMCYAVSMAEIAARAPLLFDLNGYGDFPQSYKDRVAQILEVFMKMASPNGDLPAFGDGGASNVQTCCYPLLSNDKTYDRPDYRYVFSLYEEGTPPKETAYALPEGGYYSMRNGWDKNAIYMVLKCSPAGEFLKFPVELQLYDLRNEKCCHIRRDNGTFELYAGGRNLTPDSGTYDYDLGYDSSNLRRWWYRQTKVHQTMTLNGASTYLKPTLKLWKTRPDLDTLVVENESYDSFTHRRAVFFVKKKYFVIIDEGTGLAEGYAEVHFQFTPGGIAYPDKLSARTDFSDGWNLLVKGMDTSGVSRIAEEGWVSFNYANEQSRPAFAFRKNISSGEGVRFVTLVIPYEGTVPPTASLGLVGNCGIGSDVVEVDAVVDGRNVRLGYNISKGEAWIWF